MEDDSIDAAQVQDREWMTRDEVVRVLGRSCKTLDRLIRQKKWRIEKSQRPREGKKPQPVFLRADVERIKAGLSPRLSIGPVQRGPVTVACLIEALRTHNPNAYVVMEGCDGCIVLVAGSTPVDRGGMVMLYGTTGKIAHSKPKG